MIAVGSGMILLATYDAREAIRYWQTHGLTAIAIACEIGCHANWAAIERRIVNILIGAERMPRAVTRRERKRVPLPAVPVPQPFKLGPLPERIRLAV